MQGGWPFPGTMQQHCMGQGPHLCCCLPPTGLILSPRPTATKKEPRALNHDSHQAERWLAGRAGPLGRSL